MARMLSWLPGLFSSPAGPFPAMSLVPQGCRGYLPTRLTLPPLSWGDETSFQGRCPRAKAPRVRIHSQRETRQREKHMWSTSVLPTRSHQPEAGCSASSVSIFCVFLVVYLPPHPTPNQMGHICKLRYLPDAAPGKLLTQENPQSSGRCSWTSGL